MQILLTGKLTSLERQNQFTTGGRAKMLAGSRSTRTATYMGVLSRKFAPSRWRQAQAALRTLFGKAEFVSIHYSWRPASPDPGDDLVIDCALNANASVVTSNTKDFRKAQEELGLLVMTPVQFAVLLAE